MLDLHSSVGKIAVSLVLGTAVGLERELSDKPAGLKTNVLICIGSTLFTLLSQRWPGAGGTNDAHIAAQIVSGIGFIGAGAVIAQPDRVRGLTTAASLWTVAAIGLAVGAGLYVAAVATTVLVLVILVPFKYVEDRFLATRRVAAAPSEEQAPAAEALRGKQKKARAHRRGALAK